MPEDKELFLKMVKDFYNSDSVLHKIPIENALETFYEVTSDSPYARAYIFESNRIVTGYGLVSITYSNEVGGKVLWLEELYIRNKYRNLGLGGNFLDYLHKKFKNKVKRFRLELTADNYVAKGLYLKRGFKTLKYVQMINDVKKSDFETKDN
jgi:ribosomal protein S18 acetylase RimI-like enzyme